MRQFAQSTARVVEFMVVSTDHVTPVTGKVDGDFTTQRLSKDGGSFNDISGDITIAEIAYGIYKCTLTTGHTDTIGDLALYFVASGCDPCLFIGQVVPNVNTDWSEPIRHLLQSTARQIKFFIADSSSHRGKTGLYLTDLDVLMCKNGETSFTNIDAGLSNFGELAYGWYQFTISTTHTNTIGDLAFHIVATGSDYCDFICQVVDPVTLAAINAQVDTAIVDYQLDHIANDAATGPPTVNSWLDKIMDKDSGQNFDKATDSLEAIADSGGGGLSQQQVRDAMKLAPTAGAPVAGSVDEHLDVIVVDGAKESTTAKSATVALDATVAKTAGTKGTDAIYDRVDVHPAMG